MVFQRAYFICHCAHVEGPFVHVCCGGEYPLLRQLVHEVVEAVVLLPQQRAVRYTQVLKK